MRWTTALLYFFPLLMRLITFVKLLQIQSNVSIVLDTDNRRLQDLFTPILMRRDVKRSNAKKERLRRLLNSIKGVSTSSSFYKHFSSPSHNRKGPAIFAAALNIGFGADTFCGTARSVGYTGDIVVAILPDSPDLFIKVLNQTNSIVYIVNPTCIGDTYISKVCSFEGHDLKVSFNMLRFYIYQWWARMYDPEALIMLSDFRDVFFQADPFKYHPSEWAPPVSQLVVFQEAYPNKVIYRCPFNGGWIRGCYGSEGLARVGTNTVSCSGVTMGTRDAILAYTHLSTQQLDPRVRYRRNTTKTNQGCIARGMDQGFHNWLVYSGQLDKYVDVKIFQQGEGPVNTVGAFFGERAVLKFPLETWKVLRGKSPNKYFYNWNGEISPVIHQADRFLGVDLAPGYRHHLGVFQGLN